MKIFEDVDRTKKEIKDKEKNLRELKKEVFEIIFR